MSMRTERANRIDNLCSIALYHTEERNSILEDLSKINENLQKLKDISLYTNVIYEDLKRKQQEFKKERLELLELRVQHNLDVCFPDRHFQIKLEPKYRNGKEIIDLLAGENGTLSPTKMQNGRFFRQIVSFSVCTNIQIMFGCKLILLDEATNSGDEESMKYVSMLLQALIDSGYQVVITEHKHGAYDLINRVQYNLLYDTNEKCAKVVNVSEYQ